MGLAGIQAAIVGIASGYFAAKPDSFKKGIFTRKNEKESKCSKLD